jgi:hypothetical protein
MTHVGDGAVDVGLDIAEQSDCAAITTASASSNLRCASSSRYGRLTSRLQTGDSFADGRPPTVCSDKPDKSRPALPAQDFKTKEIRCETDQCDERSPFSPPRHRCPQA